MDIGMLWYDDDAKRKLEDKVSRAVAYYRTKYGTQPNVCFVNPAVLANGQATVTVGVHVRPARTILPHHFWLGVSEN